MFIIREFECSPSVIIGICQFINDFDFTPSSLRAPASKALAACSPEANKTSSSLLLKFFDICLEFLINSLVLPAIADTTAIISHPDLCSFSIILATCNILSIEPTDVPPNFKTFFVIFRN